MKTPTRNTVFGAVSSVSNLTTEETIFEKKKKEVKNKKWLKEKRKRKKKPKNKVTKNDVKLVIISIFKLK